VHKKLTRLTIGLKMCRSYGTWFIKLFHFLPISRLYED
jgi:hypothetical protein